MNYKVTVIFCLIFLSYIFCWAVQEDISLSVYKPVKTHKITQYSKISPPLGAHNEVHNKFTAITKL